MLAVVGLQVVQQTGKLEFQDKGLVMAQTLKTLAVATVAAAGTAIQINATNTPAASISIQANASNLGNIYVGDSTVDSTTGQVLIAGQQLSLTPEQRSKYGDELIVSDIFIDADNNGESARIAITRQYKAQED